MKILWFTWKDRKHPQAGGAETVNEELAKRLVRDGHEVVFVMAGYKSLTKTLQGSILKVLKPPALTLFGHGGF